jgi:hypothetical protein
MKRQFRTIGLVYQDPIIMMAVKSAATRLGSMAIAVGPEEEDAMEVFDIFCDAIVVETEDMAEPCQKPLLVATSVDLADIPKAVEELLYNS